MLYRHQEVSLVVLKNNIIAYIDQRTSYYYYIHTNFSAILAPGANYWWVIASSIAAFILIWFLEVPEKEAAIFFVLMILWGLYFLHKFIISILIRRAVDRFLKQTK
jgi:hypothetical protein